MAKYKVEIDLKTCIGCKACTVACSNFKSNGDKAKVVKDIIEQSELKSNQEAAEGCPVEAIKITKIE
jgi:ferredoxin